MHQNNKIFEGIDMIKEVEPYWKDLISMALHSLAENGETDAVAVIRKAQLSIELNNHDNWNGGIDYWDIVFELRYMDYNLIKERKDDIENALYNAIDPYHQDQCNPIANVIIRPIVERIIDWQAVTPETKETVIHLIEKERDQLVAIATGQASFKDTEVSNAFNKRHHQICAISKRTGFDYPIKVNTLEEWWAEIKNVGNYSDRRVYISRIIEPLLEELRDSDDGPFLDFSRIETRSEVVHRAIDDAYTFIREGKYESAVDRIHTAIHGYLRSLLQTHCVDFKEEDTISALFNKLFTCYETEIKPEEVASRIKNILRSAGGMINAINEIRNNNTIAHPKTQLIQVREAKLEIRLVNAIVDYIEDVENSIKEDAFE